MIEAALLAITDASPLLQVFAAASGILAGALSMLVYQRYSPQERISQLQLQLRELQAEMSQYDGDFSGAMTLTRRNLRLSMQRLGLALGPALLSGIPVLACLPFIGHSYVSYFIAVAASALLLKFRWKIA